MYKKIILYYNERQAKLVKVKVRKKAMLFNIYKSINRILICLAIMMLWGCGKDNTLDIEKEMAVELFGEKENIFGNVEAPKEFNWRRCEGIVLDFIVTMPISFPESVINLLR